MLTKKCRKCKEPLEIDKFYPDSLGKYGVASTCIECKKANSKPQKELKKTKIALVGKKRKERLKNGGSEYKLFIEIWLERPRICEACGKPVKFFHPSVFAHGYNKKDHPEKRLDKNNIHIVHGIFEIEDKKTGKTYDCHKNFDKKFRLSKNIL